MGFMQPQLTYDNWIEVDGPNGIDFFPADLVGDIDEYEGPDEIDAPADIADYTENTRVHSVKKIKGWGCRYSAPGYMDQTPWSVYGSAIEALEGLIEQHGDEEEDLAEIRNVIDIDGLFREGHLTDADKPKLIELGLIDDPISDEEFDAALVEIVRETSAEALLQIPGIYEVLSEHFNNEALERAERNRNKGEAAEEQGVS